MAWLNSQYCEQTEAFWSQRSKINFLTQNLGDKKRKTKESYVYSLGEGL